ncbi:DUF21 domain-containing protein [Hibiscus syriacus]|uniref:DUF21 domain-containing protein n=1 Tax=Hibiscus syriacus TaxID=106335 RepID=A0A6A3A6Q7_HIBSY|nr:DUF21 domain-containing protein [Hibiscus syriacus]
MSDLTLGLMSLSLVDLEVLAKSGTPANPKILPVVKNQHLLLCTPLLCNAASMEALPIFLDSLVTAWGAILISVTLILLFGEIIPQSLCSRYGLVIGATVAPIVQNDNRACKIPAYSSLDRFSWTFSWDMDTLEKVLELTHDETTIIAGALEITEKTAKDAMTPISETFTIDINAKLDRELMSLVLEKGHSRVPVYYEQPTNIIGVLIFKVKNLLTIHHEDAVHVKSVTIRRIPRYFIVNHVLKKWTTLIRIIVQSIHRPP